MKVTTLVLAVALSILLGSIIFTTSKPNDATANSTAPPNATTGAPSEGTCASCHTGTLGTGTLAMSLVDFQTTYVPGQTDTIVIAIGNTGEIRWGFELTALKNSDNTMAGTLAPVADLAVQTGTASAGGRTYIGHRSNGAVAQFDPNDGTFWGFPGAAGWLVEWTPPGPGSGPVTIYASGVAADGQGDQGATDTTYTATLTVQEQVTSPVTTTTWGKIKKRYQ